MDRLSDARLDATIAAADRILRGTGITAVWLKCTAPADSDAARCRASVGDLDFVVRLQRARSDGYAHTCGSAVRPQAPQVGHVITLFLDCAERTADTFCVQYPTVLACSLAHELGHLLLPTSRHSNCGIMVGTPSAQDWQRAAVGRFRFSDREAAQMRAGVEERVRAAGAR